MAINKTNLVKLLQELNISTILSEQVRQKFEITLPTDLETILGASIGKVFVM